MSTSSSGGVGIYGTANGVGVEGVAFGGDCIGVMGRADSDSGSASQPVCGLFGTGGVTSSATYAYGLFAESYSTQSTSYAGYFTGGIAKTNSSFLIDHPADPENKYLVHSAVESPDMKNVYDGIGTADATGELVVPLPKYFESLNCDFRYQLTPLGAAAPALHVKEEVAAGRFVVGGAHPGQRISWQITGNRKDAWAVANPPVVEREKAADEKGLYKHPEVYGLPPEKGVFFKMRQRAMRHPAPPGRP